MPLIQVKGGWKYGKTGFVYRGPNAREQAKKQGQAIELSKLRKEDSQGNIKVLGDSGKRGTIRRKL